MRKLASIQKIKELKEHPNADKLEIARILGWNVVVRKGDFKEGDFCIYCEIDSLLPKLPQFNFLKQNKYRIKTIKLRGVLSQGIAFPLKIFIEYGYQIYMNTKMTDFDLKRIITPEIIEEIYECDEGTNVTHILGVTKYEAPIDRSLEGKVKGNFPSFIPKTDEPRIQSFPSLLERNAGQRFYISEKLDGESSTFYLSNSEFGVCTRNKEWIESENSVQWFLADKYKIEEKLRKLGREIALQGEVIGKKIQKNRYKLEEYKLFLFNIYDIEEQAYLDFFDFKEMCAILEIDSVPIIEESFYLENQNVDSLISLSDNTSIITPSIRREGIVIRSIHECYDEEIGRLSFKVVNPNYLLEHKL